MIELNNVKYQLVTLDFETFYGKDYTLSGKMNMSEYIRDPRFHAHGVGIKIEDKPTLWYTGANIALALQEIDWSKSAMIGHNVAFDGFICSHHYGVVPALYIDTLSMGRAAHGHGHRHDLDTLAKLHGLGGKVKRDSLANTKDKLELTKAEMMALGGYCKDDVNDTRAIFDKLYPFIPDPEMELIDITIRMFCDPVLEVDIPLVEEELAEEVGGKMAALLLSGTTPEHLMSNDKFARLLVNADPSLLVPMKMSPSTGKQTYAFAKSDLAFQEMARNGNDKVKALCAARLKIKSTIGETRAVRFLEAGRDGMKLPILLNFSGALTHRWSGGNKMNLQNLKRGGKLRRAIKAPKGWSVVVADSAQIEARVLAWLANQADIVNAFATKQDVYKLMASAIYNIPVEKIDKDQRFIGKICVLGLGFGMGPVKLQQTLKQGTMGPPVDIELEECERIVKMYRKKNNRIVEFWKVMDQAILSMLFDREMKVGPLTVGKNFIQLPSGLFLQYPGLMGEPEESRSGDIKMGDVRYLNRNGMSKLYGGLLTENVVQALARCIIGEQILAVKRAGYRIVTSTHDEIVVICPTPQADKCLADMIRIMSTSPDWCKTLPLSAEGGFDTCYSK